jgi:hypothetical protein
MSKTPFAQIQLPLSETNGTAAVEFYSKCQLVAHRVISVPRDYWVAFGAKRTSTRGSQNRIYEYTPFCNVY